MNDQQTIRRKLKARHSALTFFVSAFITGFVVVGCVIPFQHEHPVLKWIAVPIFLGCWITVVGSMIYLLVAYKCPQCAHPFAFKWWYGNAFTTKCLHCEVKLDGTNIRQEFQQGLGTLPRDPAGHSEVQG